MSTPLDHATYQLYETYHTQVHAQRDVRTYDHFSASRTGGTRQTELLPAYLQEMIRSIISDLNTRGDCWLLRAIVSHELPAIHLLDHSAIAYVYSTLFTPDETPRLDARSIPYSSAWSTSAGGMLYADRRAKTCVIDLRTSDTLHLLCHALLMFGSQKAMQLEIDRISAEKACLNSHITQLNDHILGLERLLAEARNLLHTAAQPVPEKDDLPQESAPLPAQEN